MNRMQITFAWSWPIPLCSHSVIGRDIDRVRGRVMLHSQAQVCNGRRAIPLHQDIFGLQVPVSDRGFSCQMKHWINIQVLLGSFASSLQNKLSAASTWNFSADRKLNHLTWVVLNEHIINANHTRYHQIEKNVEFLSQQQREESLESLQRKTSGLVESYCLVYLVWQQPCTCSSD